MSAETLREAAALMRERAEAATPGPWTHPGSGEIVAGYSLPDDDDPHSSYYGETIAETDYEDADNGDHIASWHPTVALAVADWLRLVAEGERATPGLNWRPGGEAWCALTVARAYLGGPA